MHTEATFLIDTNVLIAAEPFKGELEKSQQDVSEFLRIARANGHRIVVHPATRNDLEKTRDSKHRKQNLAAFDKYECLPELNLTPEVLEKFPTSTKSNDKCDARILNALHLDAVDFLVTSDEKLRRRAVQLGHEPRVLRPHEATRQLKAWHPDVPTPPPTVEAIRPEMIDKSQAIFDSLRADYKDFDCWIAKVKKDSRNRHCWVIQSPEGSYEAISIVKSKDEHPIRRNSYAIKISTFKVSDHAKGRRLGELLLKTILNWAYREPGRPSEIFVEVRDEKDRLIDFLEDFGFSKIKDKTHGESIFLKNLEPDNDLRLDGLEHHRRYGPPAIRSAQPIFIVPIKPKWFRNLFPDAPFYDPPGATPLHGILVPSEPHGNAIKKAYLCQSNIGSIPAGSTLLFYQSQNNNSTGDGAVAAIGVAEQSYRTNNLKETMRVAFKRTVFSEKDVKEMHGSGRSVLTILFRHDRFTSQPWKRSELQAHRVIKSWPQSVTRVKEEEAIEWIEQNLNAWR